MDWRQFTMNLENLDIEQVEQVFHRHGAQSLTYSDAENDPVLEPGPGETPLWPHTEITGLFFDNADFQALRDDLLQSLSLQTLPEHRTEQLGERVWEREWLKNFKPMRFGNRLWVSPSEMPVNDDDAVVVRLDPGLAFGTGTHETTALCLQLIDALDLRGKHVLDIGCGSGILAIAALKLDARTAHGVDTDTQAITASEQNAILNGTAGGLTLTSELPDDSQQFDVVIANILASTLISMAKDISARTVHGGTIALSGILAEQVDEVADAFVHWVTFQPPAIQNNWACLTGTRN